MLTEYNLLKETSRVYIYPSNRKFYLNEIPTIKESIRLFLQEFSNVISSFKLEYNRFIIIFISDETPLTNDQNDLLVGFIIDLEKQYKLSLLDKMNVCFKQGEYVQLKEIPDFKKLIKNRGVSKRTIVFDNFVNSKSEFTCCWEVPAEESWIAHLF